MQGAYPSHLAVAMAEAPAPVTPLSNASAASASAASAGAGAPLTPVVHKAGGKKRARAPKIDLDAAILKHQEEAKKAAKLIAEARRQVRNEKRKKQRILKKCAELSTEDVERMLILKRCNLWDPKTGLSLETAEEDVPASPAAAAAAADAAAAGAAEAPPLPAPAEAAESDGEEPSAAAVPASP